MQIYLSCDPETFDGMTQFPVTIPKRKCNIKNRNRTPTAIPITLAEQVDDAIREWYAAIGQPVPPEEIGIGEVLAAMDRAEEKRIIEARAKAEQDPSTIPSYGTPEFWAYHRAKKAEENKRRAAAGLPSVDEEKAQLAAAKAARKAAKEAKKAAATS